MGQTQERFVCFVRSMNLVWKTNRTIKDHQDSPPPPPLNSQAADPASTITLLKFLIFLYS